jgi:alpha-mannosidase
MRIAGVESTDLFIGTAQRPLQVLRVTVTNEGPGMLTSPEMAASVHVQGPGVRDPGPFGITGLSPGEGKTFEVPVDVTAPYQPGSTRRVTVTVESEAGASHTEADITVAEPGWTMWMVSHFHYDPIWWNTQGQFTEARLSLPDEEGNLPDVRTAFELVGLHLDKARKDSDYKFVLAEIDYLKPYFDAFPQDRADLRALLAADRVEIVGGNYNEPSTNLTSAESTIRNAVYGMGFQRDVFGGDPQSAWMLDVFAHDPGYPGLMAQAGLTSSSWARGPFHQWGPVGAPDGGTARMQFASEFEWLSPDGQGLLTAYMAHHYGAGWKLHTLPDLAAAEDEAYKQFRGLAQVAATRNVLLPVGVDHVIPARWVTDIHRDWHQRYVWPRFTTAIPAEFFAAVRAEAGPGGAWITPQTRDMGPIYCGKDVSYIDTKQAQRAIETTVTEAEALGTLAWLDGAPFPHAELDKAWRLLAYGAHHDAITGVESDQVYLDLAGGWREAWELGIAARDDAVAALSRESAADGLSVQVFNGVARPRDGMARVTVTVPADGTGRLGVRDQDGAPVPSLAEGEVRRADGSLAEVTLTFAARQVPGLGSRSYRLVPAARGDDAADGWQDVVGTVIENDAYQVSADPARGGTISVTDKRTGLGVLARPGNELVIQDEYAQHPRHGEGPWHLSPKGPGTGSASGPATVRAQRCPAGSRLVSSFSLDGLEVTQETLLWDGNGRVEFRTHVDGYRDHDRLLRVRFPADVPGGLPLYQTATAVIGRSFGVVDVDSQDVWYTLDNPAYQWFGLGSTARVDVGGHGGLTQAIGVAEIICPDMPNGLHSEIRDLMVALAAAGVTATCSQAGGSRYGAVDADSNVPDVRIALGGPDMNAFTGEVLAGAGADYARTLTSRLAAGSAARLWVPAARDRESAFGPDADVRGPGDLPVLIVAGTGLGELAAAVTALAQDLADARVDAGGHDMVPGPGAGPEAGLEGRPVPVPLADRSVAVLNRGTPGCVVTADGTLHMSLMRSCSAWPSGIWIDGDRRTAPDGSSFAWQHWSHTFEYALASGPGDWRTAGFNPIAEDYNHDLITVLAGPSPVAGPSPAAVASPLSVSPPNVTVVAVKPRGNPLAAGRVGALGTFGQADQAEVTVRLHEESGRPATARLEFGRPISAAWLTDLLEAADGAALPVEGGRAVIVDMPAFGTVTLVVQTNSRASAAYRDAVEPVQPVYARYWLHGKGPAPAGNMPVAVHFAPTRVALPQAGDTATLTLTVGCGAEPATGTVELDVPDGIVVSSADDLRYELAPGGYAAWHLTVRAAPGTAGGRYFAAARITDEFGQVIEDTAMVAVGERKWPDPELPPEQTIEALQDDYVAGAAELEVAVLTPELRLVSGGEGVLEVKVTNGLASGLRGEAQLVSPFGTWPLLGPWTQGFAAAPGDSATLRFTVRAPATERPGSRWWALVKIMYFGRVRYTEAVPVSIEPG